jgi:hypothetical protein
VREHSICPLEHYLVDVVGIRHIAKITSFPAGAAAIHIRVRLAVAVAGL